MKYLLLIHADESTRPGPEEMQDWEEVGRHRELVDEAEAAGVFIAAEPLHFAADGRVVERRGDDVVVTDGPFAETKEQLAGFYLLDVASMDEAVEWAQRIPSIARGRIEVREVISFGAPVESD